MASILGSLNFLSLIIIATITDSISYSKQTNAKYLDSFPAELITKHSGLVNSNDQSLSYNCARADLELINRTLKIAIIAESSNS